MDAFMSIHGNAIVGRAKKEGVPVEVLLCWLQEVFDEFVTRSESAKCEPTRMVALFMKYIERWILCRDSVRIGDGLILEVEGCDWLPFWAGTGSKPQYLLETKRRLEQMNKLENWELEYMRMGRFVRLTLGKGLIPHGDHCEKMNGTKKKIHLIPI